MLEQVAAASMPSEEEIEDCVDRLRSRRRSNRIAAERQLLAWGTIVVPTLRGYSSERLDTEQINRVRGILRRLRPRVDDTPSTLAKLLVNDPSYWSQIAAGLSGEELRLANTHLVQFGVEPLTVSAGPEQRIASTREVEH